MIISKSRWKYLVPVYIIARCLMAPESHETGAGRAGVLHVHEVPCLMDTPPSAVFHISGSAG